MQRATGPTAIDLGGGRLGYRDENLGAGIEGTDVLALPLNNIQEELASGLVEFAGLVLDGGDTAQVRKALSRLYGGGNVSLTASGALTADQAGLVLVSATGGNVVVTLPAASAAAGRPLRFLLVRSDASGNSVTIQRAGADTIEGQTSVAIPVGGRLTLVSTGTNFWIALSSNAGKQIGEITTFAGQALPPGYLWCAGQAVSRSAYAALFAVLGTGYGAGDGSTTFNLPDLRGRLPLGQDDMGGTPAGRVTNAGSGVDAATLGAAGGSQFLQQHSHAASTASAGDHQHTQGSESLYNLNGGGTHIGDKNYPAGPYGSFQGQLTSPAGAHSHAVTVDNAGTGNAQNMPPVLTINYMIWAGA